MAKTNSLRVVDCESERPVRVSLERALTAEVWTLLVVRSGAGAPERLAGERCDVEVPARFRRPGRLRATARNR